MTCARGSIFPAAMPATHLAPPQANPNDARGSVCQRTWADEVEAYARDLQARLDAMMGRT